MVRLPNFPPVLACGTLLCWLFGSVQKYMHTLRWTVYIWILCTRKCVLIFWKKNLLECWDFQSCHGIFFINNMLFRKKGHGWEQLLQLQPDITKNVVSIFIEVLYCSRVENIYYLNYFTGKARICIILNMIVLHILTTMCINKTTDFQWPVCSWTNC